MKKPPISVLLIFPPFTEATAPYLSIPMLAAYLSKKNIRVSSVDANLEFYRHFLAPEKFVRGREYAVEKFIKLNAAPELGFREMLEYLRLGRALREAEGLPEDPERLLLPREYRDRGKRMRLIYAAIRLAASPHFPEAIELVNNSRFVEYVSIFQAYSTREILRSVATPGMLAGFFESLIYPLLEKQKPGLVGISVPFVDQVLAAFRCARAIKARYPRMHITLGGPFISCHMREVREPGLFDLVDSLVLDDGQLPLERLARELEKPEPDLSSIPGLIYLHDGKIARNDPLPPLDLRTQPVPDYLIFPLDRYLVPRDQMILPYRASRGCYWARCAFCETSLSMVCRYQCLPPDQHHEQLRAIQEQTGINRFGFFEEAASPVELEGLSRMLLEKPLSLSWMVICRADPGFTLERSLLFSRAGCRRFYLGVEAYHDRLLRLIRKGISVAQVNRVLANLSWAGIEAVAYLMLGLPTETEAEARRSFAGVKKLVGEGLLAEYIYSPFHILRYSDIARHPERYGIREMPLPDGLDLNPPRFNFAGEGMSRRKVYQLFKEFNPRPAAAPLREVEVAGRSLELNYRPGEILAMIGVPRKTAFMSLNDWINLGEREVRPVNPHNSR